MGEIQVWWFKNKPHCGQPSKLLPEEQAELLLIVLEEPRQLKRAVYYISEKINKNVCTETVKLIIKKIQMEKSSKIIKR